MRVFLSSTANDLKEHRKAASFAIERLGLSFVRMEAFTACAKSPVGVCREKVSRADALVVLVAHRYGWVPSAQEGGDGEKSITWIEVETAEEKGIPVHAFLIDPQHSWGYGKEQDDLVDRPDDAMQIAKRVQNLRRLKEGLQKRVVDFFTTPHHLAMLVATSLHHWSHLRNPVFSVLDTARTADISNIPVPPPRDALDRYLSTDLPSSCATAMREIALPNVTPIDLDPLDDYIPVSGRWNDGTKTSDLAGDILRRLDERHAGRFAVAANYGEGKSFLAWHIAMKLAGFHGRSRTPIFFPLRHVQTGIDGIDILQQIQRHLGSSIDLRHILHTRDTLIILDAVEDVPMAAKTGERLSGLLEALIRPFDTWPRSAVIITFRVGLFPEGGADYLALFPNHQLASIEPWQTKSWEALLERMARNRRVSFGLLTWEEFRDEVARRPLRDLVHRPLWCRMIIEGRARILSKEVEISDPAGLYSFYVAEFFRMDEKSNAGHTLTPSQKLRIMEMLTLMMVERQGKVTGGFVGANELAQAAARELRTEPESEITSFLVAELRTNSLLNTGSVTVAHRPQHVYSFGHSSFCDYFLARRFVSTMATLSLQSSFTDQEERLLVVAPHLQSGDVLDFILGILRRDGVAIEKIRAVLARNPYELFGVLHESVNQFREALLVIWLAFNRNVLSSERPNLLGFQLQYLNLSGFDFSSCDLSYANLNIASLIRSKLVNADLRNGSCRNADFEEARTDGWNVRGADLTGALGLSG